MSAKQSNGLAFLPAHRLRQMMLKKELSPVELTRMFLDRIQEYDPKLHAFLHVMEKEAMEAAHQAEKDIAQGKTENKRLLGIPVTVCDRIHVANTPTTMGSELLKTRMTADDNVEAARLKKAGAIIPGKTNCSEFSLSWNTENHLLPPCNNPWSPGTSCGGGDGGAAVALAAGLTPLAIGIDDMGSARMAASFSGTLAIKPGHGKIPLIRDTPIPTSMRSFFQIAPLARSVTDLAMLLDVLVHYDCRDPGCVKAHRDDIESQVNTKPKELRIGWCPQLDFMQTDTTVLQALEQSLALVQNMGHQVERMSLGISSDILMHFSNIYAADMYTPIVSIGQHNHTTCTHITEYTRRWLDRGRTVSGIAYSLGLSYREWLVRHVKQHFKTYDLLITPTVATAPFPLDKPPTEIMGDAIDPLVGLWAFTLPFNMSGHPSVTIPCGWTAEGLPVGLQAIAPKNKESLLLQLASALERDADWHSRKPALEKFS